MTMQDIYESLDKIGCLSFSTIDGDYVQARIAHFFAWDDEGLYFRTMRVKPFHRQLKKTGNVTVSGMYPSTQLTGKDSDGSPSFPGGYSIRVTGDIRDVSKEEVDSKVGENPDFKTAAYDIEKYPDTVCFAIHRGKGEIFDFDFELQGRDHKLLRTRFSFGGMTVNPAGSSITDECIACGKCFEVCTFKAIVPGEPYRIIGERCDECGSCRLVCPVGAIKEGLSL